MNEQTGGVARLIINWQQYIDILNEVIASLEQTKADYPEYIDIYEEQIISFRSQVEKFQAYRDSDSNVWNLSIADCAEAREPTELKCLNDFEIPLISTDNTTHGGFIYQTSTNTWIPVWGANQPNVGFRSNLKSC